MSPRRVVPAMAVMAVMAVMAMLAALLAAPVSAAPSAKGGAGRYLVVARSAADLGGLRASAVRQGAKVLREIPQIKAMVISAPDGVRGGLAADRRALGVARDRLQRVTVEDPAGAPNLSKPGVLGGARVRLPAAAAAKAAAAGIDPDPAWDYKGLLWDYRRIGLPQGWKTTAGSGAVTVGVSDTGLDFTHAELAPKVKRVVDLTDLEDPPLCKTMFGVSDDDLAAQFGGPAETDWYGHGSWIGGNIAAALDGKGVNGIAPKVNLVSLKIAQWCGFSYSTTEIASFITAADLGVDVVNISFGGYADRSDPEQELIYQALVDAVAYARSKGTIIVAAAGNEHLRIGAGGRVLSHGPTVTPGTDPADFQDLFGQYEVPGGIPGVVDVSSTGRLVVPSSATCPPGTIGDPGDPDATPPVPADFNATCKPQSDPHQAAGQGKKDQLAYYSNYGPRIDIAGPGGARKFNLPNFDRGGTPGFPYTTDDLTNAWQDFNITSNWATQIPCFFLSAAAGFHEGNCYSTIQGTSMAAPHVAASLALVASAHPSLRKHPAALLSRLQTHANTGVHNVTRALSATDTSPGDLTGLPCPTGYCHLEGPTISDNDAYGAGLVNVAKP
jgi:lantibiotic leader peptide-processing serine protease